MFVLLSIELNWCSFERHTLQVEGGTFGGIILYWIFGFSLLRRKSLAITGAEAASCCGHIDRYVDVRFRVRPFGIPHVHSQYYHSLTCFPTLRIRTKNTSKPPRLIFELCVASIATFISYSCIQVQTWMSSLSVSSGDLSNHSQLHTNIYHHVVSRCDNISVLGSTIGSACDKGIPVWRNSTAVSETSRNSHSILW